MLILLVTIITDFSVTVHLSCALMYGTKVQLCIGAFDIKQFVIKGNQTVAFNSVGI